jgi:hypothetical protein
VEDLSQDETIWEARTSSFSQMLNAYPVSISLLISFVFTLFIFWEVRSKRKSKFRIIAYSAIALFSIINGVKNI